MTVPSPITAVAFLNQWGDELPTGFVLGEGVVYATRDKPGM